jgi:hypothetical protein
MYTNAEDGSNANSQGKSVLLAAIFSSLGITKLLSTIACFSYTHSYLGVRANIQKSPARYITLRIYLELKLHFSNS